MPTDIHLPPKIGVSHLHISEEGVFCRKTINLPKWQGYGPNHKSCKKGKFMDQIVVDVCYKSHLMKDMKIVINFIV